MKGIRKDATVGVRRTAVAIFLMLVGFCAAQANPPEVATVTASGTNGDAVLKGWVNPNGAATTAWFEWGMSAVYSNATQATFVGSGTSPISLSVPLAGLPLASPTITGLWPPTVMAARTAGIRSSRHPTSFWLEPIR